MIALGSDHAGLPLKNTIAQLLDEMGIAYKDYGTYSEERCNYPEFGYKAAVAVASGECDKGIICCGSGIGISLAANKVEASGALSAVNLIQPFFPGSIMIPICWQWAAGWWAQS